MGVGELSENRSVLFFSVIQSVVNATVTNKKSVGTVTLLFLGIKWPRKL
jgi:hypothetical protein